MRNIVFGINVSIDGCCDHSKFNPDIEVHEYFAGMMREADVLVYGRTTYQLMVPYWPDMAKNATGQDKATVDFAQAFSSVSKIIVFSKTLEKAESENTTILRGGLREEMLKLKQQPGKNILVGGVTLPSELIELGLIDEVRFVVHPVIIGKGRRLFDDIDLQDRLGLKLIESQAFKSGAVAHRYLKI